MYFTSLINQTNKRLLYPALFCRRLYSKTSPSKAKDSVLEEETPIKYSTSAAAKYKPNLLYESNTRLWYEPHVIIGCFTIFMIYFTILREENDIDEQLKTPLYNTIEGLEEKQLESFLEHSINENEQTTAAQERLKILQDTKN